MGWYADDDVDADKLVPEHAQPTQQQTEAATSATEPTTKPAVETATAAPVEQTPAANGIVTIADNDAAHIGATTSEQPAFIPDDSYNAHLGDDLEYTAEEGAQGSEEWDGTVLSTAFMKKEPRSVYRLVNEVTGQNILVDMGVLMGRKPSQDIPQGAKSVRLVDPTRTVSRNHAAISFDQDGSLWIEDYGSLNGTYVIDDEGEHQVMKGTPMRLPVPCKVRIGDQIFDFEETEA